MSIVIPKTFQLFGTTYTISQPHKVMVDKESVLGHCNSDTGNIQIRRNLKGELKELTYLHELTHAILFSLEYNKLSKDEVFVERFSKALHQAIKTSK